MIGLLYLFLVIGGSTGLAFGWFFTLTAKRFYR